MIKERLGYMSDLWKYECISRLRSKWKCCFHISHTHIGCVSYESHRLDRVLDSELRVLVEQIKLLLLCSNTVRLNASNVNSGITLNH